DFVIVSCGMKILGTVEAGRRLGISDARVRSLIASGRLKAVKVGGAWLIDPKDLDAVKGREVGRPRKGRQSTKRQQAKAKLIDPVSAILFSWTQKLKSQQTRTSFLAFIPMAICWSKTIQVLWLQHGNDSPPVLNV